MSCLYSRVAEMLRRGCAEQGGQDEASQRLAKEIVDMVVREIREKGFASIDLAACHDGPDAD